MSVDKAIGVGDLRLAKSLIELREREAPVPVNCPGHGDDVDCEDDVFDPCSACVEEGNRLERPTADTDPGECRWCIEEGFTDNQCPYHGERAQTEED